MSGYLNNLIERATNPVGLVRPRQPSIFESGSISSASSDGFRNKGELTEMEATVPAGHVRSGLNVADAMPDSARPVNYQGSIGESHWSRLTALREELISRTRQGERNLGPAVEPRLAFSRRPPVRDDVKSELHSSRSLQRQPQSEDGMIVQHGERGIPPSASNRDGETQKLPMSGRPVEPLIKKDVVILEPHVKKDPPILEPRSPVEMARMRPVAENRFQGPAERPPMRSTEPRQDGAGRRNVIRFNAPQAPVAASEETHPAVQITIGRVEVRALIAAAPKTAAASSPAIRPASLEDYLKQRNGGAR